MGEMPECRCVRAGSSKGGAQQCEHTFEMLFATNLPTGYLTPRAGFLKIILRSHGCLRRFRGQLVLEVGIAIGVLLAGLDLLAAPAVFRLHMRHTVLN